VEVDDMRNFSVNIESADNCRAFKQYVTLGHDSENFLLLEEVIDLTSEPTESLVVIYFPLINVATHDKEKNVPLILMAETMDEIVDKRELREKFKIVALLHSEQ